MKQQQDLWNDPKTQESIGLFLRQGNEFAKFMDSSQGAAKEAKTLIKGLQETTRETNALLATVRQTTIVDLSSLLTEATTTLKTLSEKSGATIEASTETINQLNTLLKRPEILETLANIQKITGNIDKTSATIALSAQDVKEGLPALIAALQGIANNIQGTTAEIKTFAGEVNKPVPSYVKILRYLVAVLAPALPVLAKR